ncbi:hypothetical protein CRENBAI_013488, partial [Crenichthys baileyi]
MVICMSPELDREKKDKYMFQAHAVAEGEVPEASQKGVEVIQVVATDADDPNTDNADILYRIVSQEPEEPNPSMFTINPVTGVIRVIVGALDREKIFQYTLTVQAADLKGEGLAGFAKVLIKVIDSNDHAPVFTESPYTAAVDENKVDAVVVRMLVTDEDEPHSPAWNAKFKIIDGDPGNLFTVKTGTNKQEGIISTAK